MMSSLLAAVTADANVLAAWETSRARLPDEPVPHEEVTAFTAGLLENLGAIAAALREGTWTPGPLRRVTIPKSDGGERVLHIPPLTDRVAERAIAAVLTHRVDPLLQPDSYGFRPGLGVEDAVSALRDRIADGERWVIRSDFVDCFGSIPVSRCVAELARVVGADDVMELVGRAAGRPVSAVPGRGLAQGSPLSPLLVNLYLDRFDRDGWESGVSVIRYADDITVTAGSREEARRQLDVLRAAAHRYGLNLSEDKTRIIDAREGVEFLGRIVRAEVRAAARLADPGRATLHVTQRGAALRASGNKFVVTGAGVNFRHPAARTRMIVCADRVLLTSAALGLAARSGVGLVVVDPYHEHSVFLSTDSGRHEVLRAQYGAEADPARRLELAAVMVQGKIANCRTLLTRTRARRATVDAEVPARLRRLQQHSSAATTVAGLLGIEGAASRVYFQALSQLIAPQWKFTGRRRRPPRDPVNAMLSYGYTVLAAQARRAVELAGFDPTRGFLHTPHRRRPSLALDLMEEFRPLLIDTAVLRLIAIGAVTPTGFTLTEAGCRMDTPTKRALIEELERRMLTRVVHPVRHRAMPYRQCLEEQAHLLARALATPGLDYTPMPWR